MAIGSQEGRKAILVKLLVLWEEGFEEAAERKEGKYPQLIQNCWDKGWTMWMFAVQVGCHEFPAQSVWNQMTKVRVRGQ